MKTKKLKNLDTIIGTLFVVGFIYAIYCAHKKRVPDKDFDLEKLAKILKHSKNQSKQTKVINRHAQSIALPTHQPGPSTDYWAEQLTRVPKPNLLKRIYNGARRIFYRKF